MRHIIAGTARVIGCQSEIVFTRSNSIAQQVASSACRRVCEGRRQISSALMVLNKVSMLTKDFLIVVRTILASPVRMMDAAFGRLPQGYGHVQRPDRKAAFHPVLIHLFRVDMPAPESDDACQRVSPLASAMRTASRLNAPECADAMVYHLCGRICS